MTGELQSLFSLPIRRWLILVGNMTSATVQMALYAAVMIAVAILIGVEISLTLQSALLILVQLGIFTWFVGMSFCALNSLIVSQEAFNIASNTLMLPLVFTSSAFYPLEVAPAWIRAIGSVNPITLAANTLRATMLNPDTTVVCIGPALALMTFLAAVASVIAAIVFYRAVR